MTKALPRYNECPTLPLLSIDRKGADRTNRITVAAYYKAQSRDFDPGHAVDDWLEAEREVPTFNRASH
jgi:hypothetical protein